ncbi:hypothetical protein NPIL_59681 [Nephila pilipes]|uniref:Uncharacterized protein n=1 Tax=Nephila pilipes TaxID=299642 RepID=A0A8X6R9Y1_NEPPI|nr:hypothetical protein NPIL_59681 [Nephila pilipes]
MKGRTHVQVWARNNELTVQNVIEKFVIKSLALQLLLRPPKIRNFSRLALVTRGRNPPFLGHPVRFDGVEMGFLLKKSGSVIWAAVSWSSAGPRKQPWKGDHWKVRNFGIESIPPANFELCFLQWNFQDDSSLSMQ